MNANDQLAHFNCTEHYYKHAFGIVYTDGVKELCFRFECYWFLDLIVSHQRGLKNEAFQVWKLEKNKDETAVISCTDGNERLLYKKRIDWTDFAATEATVWVENGIVLLPSER